MGHIGTSLKKLTPASLSLQMEDWELEVGALKKFVRLTPENRGLFFAFLGKEADMDSYLTSPVYYALTGRKGLWVYQDGNTLVPICWHPNVDGQILVFPPRGEINPQVWKKLFTEIPTPPAGIRLARIKKDEIAAPLLNNIESRFGRSITVSSTEERVLDWRYPVRTLSTERVMKMEGRSFMRARNHLRQLDDRSITIRPLSKQFDSQIVAFANRWASRRTSNRDEIKELVSPYIETMNLLKDEVFRLGGHVFFVDGQIEAVTMWELPNTSLKVANAWVSLCNTEHNGLSELVMKTTSEALWERDVPYINYGGSETKGLDDYKNKYVPAYSVELRSFDVDIAGDDVILHSLISIQGTRLAA